MATGQKVKVNVRGRVVTKTVPAKAAKKPATKAGDWFSKLSKKAQAEYIKAHPNSKYAKSAARRKNIDVVEKAAERASLAAESKEVQAKIKAKAAAVKAAEREYKASDRARQKTSNVASALLKKMATAKVKGDKEGYRRLKIEFATAKSLHSVANREHNKKVKALRAAHAIKVTAGKVKAKPVAKTTVAKAKAHETKRAADKNKVVAKTPSAKAKVAARFAKAGAIRKQRMASGAASLLKSATASLAEARIQLKEAKTIKAKEMAQKRITSIKAKIAKLKAVSK